MLFSRVVFAAALIAGCGVAAPSRVDLAALVKRFGPVDARHELELRIVKDPKDIAARLGLAKLCDEQGRPSQALEQLEAVLRYGGPIGTRWHDEDRARFARLLAARGRVRVARGAPTALADLQRASEYGAKVADDERARAQHALAIVKLRHVDAKERAAGLALLADAPREPGELGIWLWSIGAKRAAYEALAAWHAAARAPRDERIQRAYLVARAWWTPIDGAPPAAGELVGPERCRYDQCNPWDLVQNGVSSDAIDALLATSTKTSDPEAAYAWLAITLAQSLRGEGSWAEQFAARVDLTALSIDKLPPGGRAAFALVTGREAVPDAGSDRSTPGRYLAAAVAAFRGAKPDDVRALLGPLADTPDGAAVLAIASTPAGDIVEAPYRAAVTRFIQARVREERTVDRQRAKAMLDAYARDPVKADRIARDVVAEFADAAAGHAWVGALYDAIQDPARARTSWHAATDASPGEPMFVRGLAEAIARANDPDAALVIATQAAAASGDPSPVWIAIAEALHANGSDVHALEAARYAIDLATADTAARAFEIAIAASEALGRTQQANGLRTRRATIAPLPVPPREADADAWRASRWNPRDVALRAALLASLPKTDARRETVIAELVKLAGDRDVERGRAAIRALRTLGH
ncbi:MAG: hypothetical protein M4D80_04290 [Myxococcota bacterium]|nr:hypothetical protein [Myxococcota bacterium]